MPQITPFGEPQCQHQPVIPLWCSQAIREEPKSRVARLVVWIKARRHDLLKEDGEVSPGELAKATGKTVSYWSDVLRQSGKSFGEKACRETEAALRDAVAAVMKALGHH